MSKLVSVRIPDGLWELVEKQRVAEGRSFSQMLVRLVEGALWGEANPRTDAVTIVPIEALGEEDLGSSRSSAGSPAPGGAVGSSSPSVETEALSEPEGRSGSVRSRHPDSSVAYGSESAIDREAVAASGSESAGALGEGDPSGVSGDGLVSDPADAKAPSRATVASSPSPSTTAFVSGLLAREPKKGECPRVLQHRKGEFCKTCNEMIT